MKKILRNMEGGMQGLIYMWAESVKERRGEKKWNSGNFEKLMTEKNSEMMRVNCPQIEEALHLTSN